MEKIALFIIGSFCGLFVTSLLKVGGKNDEINENTYLNLRNEDLKKEIADITNAKNNAESRALTYAIKIKQIEDIMFRKDTIVNKYDDVIKLLKGGK